MIENNITEHFTDINGHHCFYLSCGPEDGPLIIFVHGWPELSRSWRHILPCFASLGFRAVAPDMRGYGRSSVYADHADFAQEKVVADLIGIIDHLGRDQAVWVGHDWGSPSVWNVGSHHPDRCRAIASLCVPYRTVERGAKAMLPLVDRSLYPEEQYPYGQWEYQRFYHEHFEKVVAQHSADTRRTVKALFRQGNPDALGKPTHHADCMRVGGWFGGGDMAPDMPLDQTVISEADLATYSESLARNGFFGPASYYKNDEANLAYSERAMNDGILEMPVLFLAARYDITCESVDSRLAEPMRQYCRDLTFEVVLSGHWMAQEKPTEVNARLARFLAVKTPDFWADCR